MKYKLVFIALALFTAGNASGAEIVLTLAGDKIGEDLRFNVQLDGVELGNGTLAKAYDTTAGQSFTKAPEEKLDETFTFDVGDEVAGKKLAVQFLNDSSNKQGQDANLYVKEVSVDGASLDPTTAIIRMLDGTERKAPVVKHAIAIYWNASAEYTVPETACSEQTIDVSGFATGVLDVPADAKLALDQLVALAPNCVIEVIGYSSTSGPTATNQAVSEARAESVAKYLSGKGHSKITSKGMGETDQFGPTQSDNRRVVVEIAPQK